MRRWEPTRFVVSTSTASRNSDLIKEKAPVGAFSIMRFSLRFLEMRAHLFNTHGERLFFNEEERTAFIQTADLAENQKTRTFCSLLHYTGCNFTEAMKFTPQQVHLDSKAIGFPGPHHSQFSRTIPVPDS